MALREDDDQRIAQLTREGWSAKEIAKELGFGERAIHRSRQRTGVDKPGPRFLTPDEVATVERLLADGASCSEAARTIGRSVSTLSKRYPRHVWTPEECGKFGALVRYSGVR